MNETGNTEYLLTPGPLTTSLATKQAMLKDWGSRDHGFIALTGRIRSRLVDLIDGGDDFVAVPVQGSGTFAIEATLGTLVPRDGKLLVLINGAYGQRMRKIADVMGRRVTALEWPEDQPVDAGELDLALSADKDITHVAVVHCETTSGILNPIAGVAETARRHGRSLLIDAMSAFGAIPLSAVDVPFDAVIASSNKCLEGVPGFGFAIIRRQVLEAMEGNAHSLALDLYDQWRGFEKNSQWRFTPPTHVLAAFGQALDEHEREGGVAGRGARYTANCTCLVDGMRALGFETLLPDALQAPIIVTFHMPADPKFDFQVFYDSLADAGFVIYPGKLTVAESFRIGCIGQVHEAQIRVALTAIAETIAAMGVATGAPAAA